VFTCARVPSARSPVFLAGRPLSAPLFTIPLTPPTLAQSLSTLGGVIYALGINSNADDDNQRHVPYRDSKLTLLLKSSLSVTNCKTTMVMNVSPCGSQFAETLSTLKFAQRVKLIKADPTAKARFSVTVNTEEERLRKEVNQVSRAGASRHFVHTAFVAPASCGPLTPACTAPDGDRSAEDRARLSPHPPVYRRDHPLPPPPPRCPLPRHR